MQHLEVSGAVRPLYGSLCLVRPLYGSLGLKGLVSSVWVLLSGCVALYYMLDAQLFLRPQHVSDSVAGCDALAHHTLWDVLIMNTNACPYRTHNALCGQIVELLHVRVTTTRSSEEFRPESSGVCCLYTPCIHVFRTTFRVYGDNFPKRQ